MVVILRIADEVIAGRQVFNLDTGAGGVDSFALCTVFHRCIHAGDFAVAAALGSGRDTDQAVRRFLRGFADAPRCGHGLSAAVRPFAGLGCDANGVIARVRGGVAGDVHCGGIIAAHGCGMHRAVIGICSRYADVGLCGIGGHGRRVLLEDCLDLHLAVRHGELIVLDGHAAADDLPLLEVIAGFGRSGQGDLRTDYGLCMRGGSRAVSVRFHGDGKLGRCRNVLLEDSFDLHVVVRHGELIVLDGHAAAHDLPLLEVVVLVGRGGQGDRRTSRSGGRTCGASAVSVIADGDGVGGGGNNAVFPQSLDFGIPVHCVGISHLVLRAADLPSLELLIGGSSEAALWQDVICPCLDGNRLHAAAAAACVEGDCAIRKLRTIAHDDHGIGAGKVVVILRIADEVIAGRQVFNLDTGAGGVDSFALCTVFHRCIHAGDFAVAAALGSGRDTDQAVRRFLRGFADAPRCGHGLSAAVRPFAGLGCDANGVIARVRGGVAGDVHCGGIIAAHGCGMHRAVIGICSRYADVGLCGIGGHGRRVLLEDCLDLHLAVRHGELIVLDGHAAADDLPLLEVVALIGHGGQGDRRTSRSGGRSCGAGAVAVRFHGDGKLGRRVFGYRNRQLLRIAAHAVFRLNGEFGGAIRSRRAADLAGVLVQAQTGRQIAAVNAPCDRHGAGGNQGLAVRLAHLTVRQSVRGDGNGIDAGLKLCHQLGYICRNAFTGRVQVSVAAKPHKVAAGISVGAGQTIGCRRSKFASVFYNDLDIIRAAAQFAAAKVKGNGFQPIRLQCIRVQNFKDGAETEVRSGVRSIGEIPIANRAVPTHCTALCPIVRNILSPRICRVTVSDISVIFVQYLVPFVALRVAAYRIARASIRTSC